MKTKNVQPMSKIKLAILLFATLQISFTANASEISSHKSKNGAGTQDTTSYFSIEGKIIDQESKAPLVFANIYLVGENVATVSNTQGEFIIKVPNKFKNGKLEFSYIGYKNKELPISEMENEKNVVKLEPMLIPLAEVTIRPEEPIGLIRGAMRNIPENFSTEPLMLTAFYRETIKQNKNYVAVSEGVMDVYKAPYNNEFKTDLIKVFKGRKSTDVKKMDTVMFKLQGGPNTTILLDVVKNPYILLSNEYLEYYNYKLDGIVSVNDKQNYKIEFKQNYKSENPLYNGIIYLDVNNLAITGIEFSLNTTNIDEAAKLLVRKKPSGMKVTPGAVNYLVNYREKDGKWYLNYMRAEVQFKCNWEKRLFSSVYTTMSEMAITDMDMENVERFKYTEASKPGDIFLEKVGYFKDDSFWGEYNYIKPDESIESAIKKLSRKLKNRE